MQIFKQNSWKCVIDLGATIFNVHPLTKHTFFLRVKKLITGQVSLKLRRFPSPLIL